MTGPRSGRLAALVALVAALVLAGLPRQVVAQQPAEDARPAWVLFERGNQAARNGDGAGALRLYSEALARDPSYPEALVGIGKVHEAAGDLELAIRYYERALELERDFRIPQDTIAVRLELEDLYNRRGRPSDEDRRFEILDALVQRNPVYAETDPDNQRIAMRRTLLDAGIDQLLVLYRLNTPETLEAHRRYAELLETLGDRSALQAELDNRLFVVVQIASRAVDELIARQFDYQFTTLSDFLTTTRTYPELAEYLHLRDFGGALRRLALVLRRLDDPRGSARAAEIEAIVASNG